MPLSLESEENTSNTFLVYLKLMIQNVLKKSLQHCIKYLLSSYIIQISVDVPRTACSGIVLKNENVQLVRLLIILLNSV